MGYGSWASLSGAIRHDIRCRLVGTRPNSKHCLNNVSIRRFFRRYHQYPTTLPSSRYSCERVAPSLALENSSPAVINSKNFATNATKSTERKIEDIYQRKTPIEHILLRPGMYIGSTGKDVTTTWLFDEQDPSKLALQDVEYVPGIVKLFDEILVNALDNKERDKSMNLIKVDIHDPYDSKKGPVISVWNNGRGIPVKKHRKENVYVPELVLGNLLTGSNFDDSIDTMSGGRYGYGAKLTNIFSTRFTIETTDKKSGKKFEMTWTDNMQTRSEPTITSLDKAESDYTRVTFRPDLAKFGQETLDEGSLKMIMLRTLDAAAVYEGVTVELNGKQLPVAGFQKYVELLQDSAVRQAADQGISLEGSEKAVYHKLNRHWEFAVGPTIGAKPLNHLTSGGSSLSHGYANSPEGMSFVNGIRTNRGGSHVSAIMEQLCRKGAALLQKKRKDLSINAQQVRNHIRLYLNTRVQNPSFDSQSKDFLTTSAEDFGTSVSLSDATVSKLFQSSGLEDAIIAALEAKQKAESQRAVKRSLRDQKVKGIPKLEDANWAGGRKADQTTLILTEGDSAKALAVAGLAIVGRDKYGVFPLRGKLLNVRELNPKSAVQNSEVAALLTILGLDFNKTYKGLTSKQRGLRYGKVLIMTDQDDDGNHIKGLLINLFHNYWPELLKEKDGFLEQFITPVVKAKKGKQKEEFFSVSTFHKWFQSLPDASKWSIKYYKGLGTSTAQEGREYFSNLDKHLISFYWSSENDGDKIDMAFSKKRAEDRKKWLLGKPLDDVARPPLVIDSSEIATEDTNRESNGVSFGSFIDEELVEFSKADLARSIPSVIDGLKPSQRKVLFASLKRAGASSTGQEIKVAQLAGYCAEKTAYHHGEASLIATIVNMAHDFVGSNNVPLLQPIGQFGTRLAGGKDAASARYIFTKLSSITRMIFPSADDALLAYRNDDGAPIEPTVFVPILPMALVNGAEGIGTGWSTSVPSYHPVELIDILLSKLGSVSETSVSEPQPWFRGFTGTVTKSPTGGYVTHGSVKWESMDRASRGRKSRKNEDSDSDEVLTIDELPVGKWTDDYKSFLLGLQTKGLVESLREYHSETSVKFQLSLTEKGREMLQQESPNKALKLSSSVSTKNIHLFDTTGTVKKYHNPLEIVDEFFDVRLDLYRRRRRRLIRMYQAEARKASSKQKFIRDIINGDLKIAKRNQADILQDMANAEYVNSVHLAKQMAEEEFNDGIQSHQALGSSQLPEDEEGNISKKGYEYLLNLPFMQLTQESINKAQAEEQKLTQQLQQIEKSTPEQLWIDELRQLREELLKDHSYDSH
eukprot:gb/GECG01002284.1/.p1 GENE.gb/GECG01002284.1/~~gb/GECG01002284.1/.p1  ORF type:complete len:1313 (+),score=209.12 gb/GECG01002284.1/:1-3939(+)